MLERSRIGNERSLRKSGQIIQCDSGFKEEWRDHNQLQAFSHAGNGGHQSQEKAELSSMQQLHHATSSRGETRGIEGLIGLRR